jgi:hypothetical protein
MEKHRIAVIAGDGIGQEVVPEGMRPREHRGRRQGGRRGGLIRLALR